MRLKAEQPRLAALSKPWTDSPPLKACHNCRRRRLRCDRSFPGCQKCSSKGEECLGYGNLLRWTNAVASRGKLAGHTHTHQTQQSLQAKPPETPSREFGQSINIGSNQVGYSLVDPLLQDLSPRYRQYVGHFTENVCRDLISFHQQNSNNPFRSIITLLGRFDYLREAIIATSAVHMGTLLRCHGAAYEPELVDALAAKGRAYHFLRSALDNMDPVSRPFVLIAIVFFMNFDLIDSGKGGWKTHIKAAAALIKSLQTMGNVLPPSVAILADMVSADCITYHVLGSAFADAGDAAISAFDSIDILSILRKAEPYSYQCSPPAILFAILRASRLSSRETEVDVASARTLLEQTLTLDVRSWVHSIRGLSPSDDLEVRESIASAHRAAAALYIMLVVPETAAGCYSTDSLVVEILAHLASVPIEHMLSKGTVWPTFIAGAQTDCPARRDWCLGRLQTLWRSTPWICPWGYIETAIIMLQGIWEARDKQAGQDKLALNWLQELKGANMSDRCMIV